MERPKWVQLGLWKVPTRSAAITYLRMSLSLAAVGVIAGVAVNPWGFFGAGLVFAALWYWRAIVWMDTNQGWSPPPEKTREEVSG